EIEANVLLHGDRGTPVTLLAEITEAVELVVLNGVAEDPLRLQGGSGLAGMSERLVAAGGTVEGGGEGRNCQTTSGSPGGRAGEPVRRAGPPCPTSSSRVRGPPNDHGADL